MIRRQHKLYEAQRPVPNRIYSILIGARTIGDDGVPAEVTSVYLNNGIPQIDILQDDGVKYVGFNLADYLDNIFDDCEEREEIEDYLDSLGLLESVKTPKKKLVLNEEASSKTANHVFLAIDGDDSKKVTDFILWSRELMKEVGLPAVDPKSEKVYIKDGNIYYQGPYMGFKPGKAKMLQARLQKYVNKETFPEGMMILPEHGLFVAALAPSGEVRIK